MADGYHDTVREPGNTIEIKKNEDKNTVITICCYARAHN